MNKKLRKQAGFTMAEVLIVVAIIGVLVAISIPIFGPRLEGSRESTDVSNLRSAYAAATSAVLVGKIDDTTAVDDNGGIFVYTKDGKLASGGTALKGKSTQDDWQGTDLTDDLPSSIKFDGNSNKGNLTVKIDADNNQVWVTFVEAGSDFPDASEFTTGS